MKLGDPTLEHWLVHFDDDGKGENYGRVVRQDDND